MRHTGGGITLTLGTLMLVLATGGLWGVPGRAAAAGGEAAFVGLTPCRLVDTRGNGFGGPFGPPELTTGVCRGTFRSAGSAGSRRRRWRSR